MSDDTFWSIAKTILIVIVVVPAAGGLSWLAHHFHLESRLSPLAYFGVMVGACGVLAVALMAVLRRIIDGRKAGG